MELFDDVIVLQISKYLNQDLINVMLVSKQWFSIFHPMFLYLKPKMENHMKLTYFLDNLKLGYPYNKCQTICNIYRNYHELNNKDKIKLKTALQHKLYLEKPSINYVSLKEELIINNYLLKLI